MHGRSWFVDFIVTFVITFIVTLLVTLFWSLIADGSAVLDWGTSFRFAIIFGVVIPLLGRWGQSKKD